MSFLRLNPKPKSFLDILRLLMKVQSLTNTNQVSDPIGNTFPYVTALCDCLKCKSWNQKTFSINNDTKNDRTKNNCISHKTTPPKATCITTILSISNIPINTTKTNFYYNKSVNCKHTRYINKCRHNNNIFSKTPSQPITSFPSIPLTKAKIKENKLIHH